MSLFLDLDQTGRSNFLRALSQSLGCTYVCFWIYIRNPANCSYIGFGSCLKYLDGLFLEEEVINTQLPSSSSGSYARRLFDEYRQSTFSVAANNDHVPGFAFKHSFPYLELQELDLRRLTSNDTQRQFYQEARIKTAVFMGCKIGELELGLPNVPQINMKMELKSWFPEEFPTTQSQLVELINPRRPLITEQNPPTSSSSSLRSFSIDSSPEYSSLLFNIPPTNTNTCQNIPEILSHPDVNINPPPIQQPIMPHHQEMQSFARLRNIQFPNLETEAAAMTKAILAVLTSPSPPASSSSSPHQPSHTSSTYNHDPHHLINPKSSAFKSYTNSSLLASQLARDLGSKKTVFKRSISFYRGLNFMRNHQRLQVTRPSSTQLHHMISERKRREKLNESFHGLRALLPPGTKKDKASLLNTTREYLIALKAQVEELSRRNKQLEAQVFPSSTAGAVNNEEATIINESSSSDNHERLQDVRLRHVSGSTSEEAEIVDLHVTLRAAIPAEDLVLRILEFLRRDQKNVSMISMEANSRLTESSAFINRVTFRLRVLEGSEWDGSAFQEAVRRVVADLAQ
ncbi:hypothetical protein L484_027293 [Morus notabilis]|uniref:BHLH domain-containing protein n=2 Tax=Morus notabilis TaxID=981085 RepID=W9QUP1_9ROSA|nr:hypothetical protein L484_027293 [Morus notabilis]